MPEFIRQILSRLLDAGFEAYAVGGCVRDTLLGRVPHDWDVAASARDSDIAALFERTVPTGAKYGTVTVLLPGGSAEVTTFRVDGTYLDGRRPETVAFVSDLREDLSRRDLTVNAMAMDVNGDVVDLFGGREDLRRGIIRCVGDPERRFSEDALRMLRAVRFSAQLGFGIEPGTLAAVRKLSPLAEKVSAERVRAELVKTLASPRPEIAGLMIEYGLLRRFMTGPGENFRSDLLPACPEDLRTVVFALLAHLADMTDSAAALLRDLRCPAREVKLASEAEAVLRELDGDASDTALLTALTDHSAPPVLAASAALGRIARAERIVRERRYARPGDLAVRGSDLAALGFAGADISRALRALALSVTFGQAENTREALLGLAEKNVKDS